MGRTTQTSLERQSQKSTDHSSKTSKTQPTPAVTPAHINPADLSADNILQLQHTIGNHAVQRMLESQRKPVEVKNAAPQATVQRLAELDYDDFATKASAALFAAHIDADVDAVL